MVHEEALFKLLVLKLGAVLDHGDHHSGQRKVFDPKRFVAHLFRLEADIPKHPVHWALLGSLFYDVGDFDFTHLGKSFSELVVRRVFGNAAHKQLLVDLELGFVDQLVL